jgi:GT2 family glycosyltransferase
MLFRRSLFAAAGLWDEGYFAYWVDTDWCFKVQRSGWAIYCVPQASVVHHEQNHSGKKKSARRIWMFHYGAYRFYRNNRTLGTLDPRAIAALFALTVRGLFQLAQSAFVTETPAVPAPGTKR